MITAPATPATDTPAPAEQPGSLAALFVAEESRLLLLARGITGDFAAAQDIVQEAFLKLHERYSTVREPRAWLLVAVRRGALDHRRRRKPSAGVHSLLETPDDSSPRPDEVSEKILLLRLRLGDLPPRDRELVKLRFEDDLDYAGIANRTGMSVGNVGYRLHHVLRRLGDALRRKD